MKIRSFSVILFLHCFYLSTVAEAKSYLVASKSELQTAHELVVPGDSIILKDKMWSGLEMVLTCNGSEGNPITICAESPGGAVLISDSRIRIGGDYLVVSGFHMLNGKTSYSPVEFFVDGNMAHHSRLTDCMINNWAPKDASTKMHWLVMEGSYNRIDHCEFVSMFHQGVTIMIKAGADQEGHYRIDHNYFGPKPDGGGNAYESIKLGGGDYSSYSLYTTVEKNYFYRCDGEVELISNKSWNNVYRHNTFVECQGTITLRWGRECVVEGNYFLGEGVKNTGGIRVTDQDHQIVNNYFENLEGEDARAAISIMSGIPDIEGGNSGHGQAKNVHILHNTVINCKESFNLGYYDKDDIGDPRGDLKAPENILIANNIWWSTKGELITEGYAGAENINYLNNLGFGSELGVDEDSGIEILDPKLTDSSGIWKLTELSPAIDAAHLMESPVSFDFEEEERADGKPDIGADEWSAATGVPLPVGQEDVGTSWEYETSVDELQHELAVMEVYPNPSSGVFYLSLGELCRNESVRVDVLDLSGRIIYTKELQGGYEQHEVSVEGHRGLHLLRLSGSFGVQTNRIIFN